MTLSNVTCYRAQNLFTNRLSESVKETIKRIVEIEHVLCIICPLSRIISLQLGPGRILVSSIGHIPHPLLAMLSYVMLLLLPLNVYQTTVEHLCVPKYSYPEQPTTIMLTENLCMQEIGT